jgi:hypothetical protein
VAIVIELAEVAIADAIDRRLDATPQRERPIVSMMRHSISP